jgi:O-antigen/teichoic acid export membrane protein
MQLLIGLASLVLVIDALQVFFYGVLRGFQELQYEAAGIFSGMITTATVGGIVLWLVPSLPLLILALLAGSSVNLLVSAGRVIQRIGWHAVLPHWSTKEAKSLLAMAFPFALAAVFVKMYSYIDSIFISKFLDITAVGIYAIAYKYTYAFQFLPLSFIAALYPGMSAVVGKDESTLKDVFMRSLWYMAFLCVPIVFGLFAVATEAIGLAGEGYEASVPVFRVLIFVLIPIFLDFPIGALLNAAGRQSSKTAIMGMTMVINVLLNLLLIPQMGILGAAYAALASFIFMLLAGLWLVPSVIPTFSFLELFRRTVPVYVVGMIMFIVVVALKPMVGWLPVIAVGAIVYLGGLMLLGSITWNDLRYFRRV